MNRVLAGLVSGLIATVPMTAVMLAMHRALPPDEQYPLPPAEITEELVEEAGLDDHLSDEQFEALAFVNHFAYGAASGGAYALLSGRQPLPPAVAGSAFGLALWAGSYLGWVPAMGLLAPATRHPGRRVGLMIAAHLVWGCTTGLLVERLEACCEAPGPDAAA